MDKGEGILTSGYRYSMGGGYGRGDSGGRRRGDIEGGDKHGRGDMGEGIGGGHGGQVTAYERGHMGEKIGARAYLYW